MSLKRILRAMVVLIVAGVGLLALGAPASASVDKNGQCESGSLFGTSDVCLYNFVTYLDFTFTDNNHFDDITFFSGQVTNQVAANTMLRAKNFAPGLQADAYICNGVFFSGPCFPIEGQGIDGPIVTLPGVFANNNESNFWA